MEQDNFQLKQAVEQLRNALVAKDQELTSVSTSFNEIKDQLAQIGDVIKARDTEIEGLRSTIESTMVESKNKDNVLFRTKAKLDVLTESATRSKQESLAFQKKCEELQKEKTQLESSVQASKHEIEELQSKQTTALKSSQGETEKLDATLKNAQGELESLRIEKSKLDERITKQTTEIEKLEKANASLTETIANSENEKARKLEEQSKLASASTRIVTGRDNIIKIFNELLKTAMHSVMLVLPTMKDLKEFDLLKLKPSVKIMITTRIDMKNQHDLDTYQALTSLETHNIDFRSFDNEDRFGINVDRGVVFIGVNSKSEPFGLLSYDTQAIDLFVKQFLIETWTLGRSLSVKK
nr:hypothetical protein [Candidatus Sigynarchaeota archaeon]